ncbi:MAG: hypothetical protein AAF813_06615 [Pseudomonadota bacterium]
MRPSKLPKLVRFMAFHAIQGFVIGSALLLGFIWLDILGLGTLLQKDHSGLATAVLFIQNGLTFGAVSMGIAVMRLGKDDEEGE